MRAVIRMDDLDPAFTVEIGRRAAGVIPVELVSLRVVAVCGAKGCISFNNCRKNGDIRNVRKSGYLRMRRGLPSGVVPFC